MTNHTPPHLSVISDVCIRISQKDREVVRFKSSKSTISFFHEFRVLCTRVWIIFLYQTQRDRSKNFKFNTHTLSPDGTHSSTQLCQLRACKYPQLSLGELCWLIAGVEEFSPLIHAGWSSSIILEPQSLVDQMPATSRECRCDHRPVGVFFSCEWSDVSVSNC